MSDAPIKAALREAARALCGPEEPMRPVRRFVGDTLTTMTLLESNMEDAAAAIAAFLRALDDGAVLRLMSAEEDRHKGWRDILADAVERAAKGGGDE